MYSFYPLLSLPVSVSFLYSILAATNVAKLLLRQEDEETVSSQANNADTANLDFHKWLNSVSCLQCISGSSYPRFLDAERALHLPHPPPHSHTQAWLCLLYLRGRELLRLAVAAPRCFSPWTDISQVVGFLEFLLTYWKIWCGYYSEKEISVVTGQAVLLKSWELKSVESNSVICNTEAI